MTIFTLKGGGAVVKSVMSGKVEIRESKTHQKGMFAVRSIKKGETTFIKGGYILKREQIFSSGLINSYYPIDDQYFLGAVNIDEEDGIKLYINHSCNPNCGIRGEITFVAIRDIDPDEELTTDYAFLDNEDYSFKCNCGESCCRSIITGSDWKIKEIQDKYFNYFAVYLKEKILCGKNQ
jgi:SET domain-containing protein